MINPPRAWRRVVTTSAGVAHYCSLWRAFLPIMDVFSSVHWESRLIPAIYLWLWYLSFLFIVITSLSVDKDFLSHWLLSVSVFHCAQVHSQMWCFMSSRSFRSFTNLGRVQFSSLGKHDFCRHLYLNINNFFMANLQSSKNAVLASCPSSSFSSPPLSPKIWS